jgi:hypothetical protein
MTVVYNAKARARRLKVLFRLTPEEHSSIREFQKNHKVYQVLLGKREGTDHHHASGKIRGILEWRLNRAYGLIESVYPDNVSEVLRALADYHDNPPATQALGEERFGLIGKAQYKKRMVYGPPKEK